MFIPDGDVDFLAQDMIKHFPADAADRAMLSSNAFFLLGRAEASTKFRIVTDRAGGMATTSLGTAASVGPRDSNGVSAAVARSDAADHVAAADFIACETDTQVQARADRLLAASDFPGIEVWDGGRRVHYARKTANAG